jgi:hypothetical protein
MVLACLALAGCSPPLPTPRFPAPIVRRTCGPGAPAVVSDRQWSGVDGHRIAVRPARPIAGDDIRIWIPYEVARSCGAAPPVQRQAGDGVTLLRVPVTAPCPALEDGIDRGFYEMALGSLEAGRYLFQAGTLELAFTVLPADTDVGPLSDEWLVRMAISSVHPSGTCFGMPPGRGLGVDWVRRRDPLLWRRTAAAFPSLTDEQRAELLLGALLLELEPAGSGRFRYTVTDGRCCDIEEHTGEAVIAPDCRVQVKPARSTLRNVPC